jgi:tellurium resistance protein TerD
MSVSLSKGGNVSLTKEAGGSLRHITVGLGWDPRATAGTDFDLDASALCVGTDKKVVSDAWFVFYGNLESPAGAVKHQGDNLTGDGDGDDEVITVDLGALPSEVDRVIFPVTIYQASERGQNFGMVDGAFIRVVNTDTGAELARFDLSEDGGGLDCVVFGEVYRDPSAAGEWKLKAVEQGFNDGLGGLARAHGVNIG